MTSARLSSRRAFSFRPASSGCSAGPSSTPTIAAGLNALVDAWGSDVGADRHPVPARREQGDVRGDELRPVLPRPHGRDPRLHGGQQGARGAPAALRVGQGLGRPARDGRRVPGLRGLPPRLPAVHGDACPAGALLRRLELLLPPRAERGPGTHADRSRCTRSSSSATPDAAQAHRDAGLEVGIDILQPARPGHGRRSRPTTPSSAGSAPPWRPTRRTRCSRSRASTPIGAPTTPRPSSRATATATTSAARSPSRPTDGATAHSACVAFGVDRITLGPALHHGLDRRRLAGGGEGGTRGCEGPGPRSRRRSAYEPHRVHGDERMWLESNCAADLWIEVLHALGLEPLAGHGLHCSAPDFDGEQWPMFKFSMEDVRRLYGIDVYEVNLWRAARRPTWRTRSRSAACSPSTSTPGGSPTPRASPTGPRTRRRRSRSR